MLRIAFRFIKNFTDKLQIAVNKFEGKVVKDM